MSDVFFLVLRRLRTPLILLISVYAIATTGLTLIPGIDEQGNPWQMTFFQAFYFVSFMGSTIGFGEIPHAFTDGQRAWVLICIYTSVIAWLYGIGSLLRLLQDDTFTSAVAQRVFKQNIKSIHRPFYIVCGYGETGALIVKGLSELEIQAVIIDIKPDRTRTLELEGLLVPPIILNADVSQPNNLIDAGIRHDCCQGIIAVTESDHTNLKIAVSAKLLEENVPVICRSENEDEADNMASFGTDVIINPYHTFAQRLKLLTQNPALHRVHNWFINQQSSEHLKSAIRDQGLPRGKWILCGFGRFGKAIHNSIKDTGVEIVVVDVDPIQSRAPGDTIVGRGTEADTLIEAGINEATVLIAASSDDANNLSVLITGKQVNPNIVTIGRVSNETDTPLFVNAQCDYIMRRSQVISNETLTAITRPLVTRFLRYSPSLSAEETEQLVTSLNQLCGPHDPVTWRVSLNQQAAPALENYLKEGSELLVQQLCESDYAADSVPLLLLRDGMSHLLPSLDMPLRSGDELLLGGVRGKTFLAQKLSHNPELVDTILAKNPHTIPLLRWLNRRRTSIKQSA